MEEIKEDKATHGEENINHINQLSMHVNLKSLLQNKEQFRCVRNNVAINICSNQKCQNQGLICGQWKCQCQNVHKKCKTVFLWRVIESILSKKQNLSQKVKQSYQALSKNIDKIIDELSQLRLNLESQQQYFGLFKSELKFVDLVQSNKMDKICGKLINQMQNTFEVQVQFDMLSKDLIQKDFEQKRKQFSKLCKQIQDKYSKKQKSQIKADADLLPNSKLIIKNEHKQLLAKWIKQIPDNMKNKLISSKLLFRGSEHQFSAIQFFKYCQGQSDTIVIVRNQYGKTFGGFTHPKWQKGEDYQADNTKKSFLFSLDQKIKISCTDSLKCINYSSAFGPLFGNDFGVNDKANLNSQRSFLPYYYYKISSVNEKYLQNENTHTLLTGNAKGEYKVTQYQVYQIFGLQLQ